MLSVKDTGPGIPKEEIPKVMQAFGQGSLAHQTAEGGTGLGLPIVQNLVDLHGGTFELRSELRKGTEAIVILPPKPGAAAHAAAAAAGAGAPPPAGRRRRATAASRRRPRADEAARMRSGNPQRTAEAHCHAIGALPTFTAQCGR